MSDLADGRSAWIPDGDGMTYVMTTTNTGDLETFRKVNERIQPHAHGLVALYAGASDSGMSITAIWESKAHADRFTAEHLIPALTDIAGARPEDGGSFIDFEATEVLGPVRA